VHEAKRQYYHFINAVCQNSTDFWATVCKTVRPMLSDRFPVCHVCNVGVLWPNSWMDLDETWHAGMSRPWPHCVRWGPNSPSPKRAQPSSFRQLSVVSKRLDGLRCHCHLIGPGDFVFDGDPAPTEKRHSPSPNFWPMSIVATVAHLSYC